MKVNNPLKNNSKKILEYRKVKYYNGKDDINLNEDIIHHNELYKDDISLLGMRSPDIKLHYLDFIYE